nr:MFS transporter [Chitinivorax tropicus]
MAMTLNRSWMFVGWITIFLVGTDLFIVSPFLPAIGQEVHQPAESLAMLVSVFSIAYAIACPIQAKFAERFGVGKVLQFGILLIGLANLYTSLAADYSHLLLSRALAGLGAASISPMIYTLTAERTLPAERAGKLAQVNSGLVIALVLGAPFGLLLGTFSGWRLVFAGLAVAFLLVLPINNLAWQAETAPAGRRGTTGRVATQEKLSDAVRFFACMICWSACVYATYTLLPTAMSSEYQVKVSTLASLLTSYGIGAALGGLLGGKLADRIGPATMVRLAFAMMAVTLGVLYFTYPLGSVNALLINLFLISLVAYGFFPALQACAAQRFTVRRPTVMGFLSSSLYVGMTTGAAVGGQLFGHSGMTQVILFSTSMALIGLAIASGISNQPTPTARTQ